MEHPPYVSTTNACKLCTPLGACLAFRGVEGAVPMLHGSQGCATYMRRYIISHFREPMDIASSSLGEKHAVYGGASNLKQGLLNVMTKYGARLIGIATTCLTETIGDDAPMIVREFRREMRDSGLQDLPALVTVSTPSYSGTHMEGFHAAVRAIVEQASEGEKHSEMLNLLPGFLSPADLRHLREIIDDFQYPSVILPDFSMTLDGPALQEYEKIPRGGTPLEDIRRMGGAAATFEFGATLDCKTAGNLLHERFGVPLHSMGIPIGLRETDIFFDALENLTGAERPERHVLEEGTPARFLRGCPQIPFRQACGHLRRRGPCGCAHFFFDRGRNHARALRIGRKKRAVQGGHRAGHGRDNAPIRLRRETPVKTSRN